jgi:hypothetical protein
MMNSWKRFPLIALCSLGLLLLFVGCTKESNPTVTTPEGHLTLAARTLDFSTSITEQTVNVSNTGDTSLTWTITASTIPYWAKVSPTSGTLASNAQTTVTARVFRAAVGPGTTTADLFFDTDANDDTLTLSVQRTCDLVGDDFNDGNASAWDATDLDKSQGDGYVVLDPNSAGTAGRLLRSVSSIVPCVISARLERTAQDAGFKQYGLFLEGSGVQSDALYFTVYVDNDTNYTLEQRIDGQWDPVPLAEGLTSLISTDASKWNILRLELYQSGQNTLARGYADTTSTPLFEGIAIDPSLSFIKMGIRSEEYTIHADWFCAARP